MYPQMNQPGQVFTYKCGNCGSPLPVQINQEFVTCQYCGSANQLPHQAMTSTVSFDGVQVNGRTDVESLLRSADYAINCKQYEKARDVLFTAIMTGSDDYRIYCEKIKVDLWLDDNRALFEDLARLQELEVSPQNANGMVTNAICQIMQYRGLNGITILHNAAFHELYNTVVYCVEHRADVNSVAGFRQVTPISIMFVPQDPNLTKLDGTPFIRNKNAVKVIRDYLMAHGARDIRRRGY
jgi:hypothetical protein